MERDKGLRQTWKNLEKQAFLIMREVQGNSGKNQKNGKISEDVGIFFLFISVKFTCFKLFCNDR